MSFQEKMANLRKIGELTLDAIEADREHHYMASGSEEQKRITAKLMSTALTLAGSLPKAEWELIRLRFNAVLEQLGGRYDITFAKKLNITPLTFTPPAFEAPFDSPSKWWKRATNAWMASRKEQIANVKSELKKAGFVPAKRSRSYTTPVNARYEMTARRLFKGESYPSLAEAYKVDERTARQTVQRLCKEIGISPCIPKVKSDT